MINKTAFTVIVSIILTILIVALVNVGLSIFLEAPNYGDFCDNYAPAYATVLDEKNPGPTSACSNDTKICDNGKILSRDYQYGCMFPSCSDRFKSCQDEYDSATKDYNQKRFYVFAIIGFILLLLGLFVEFNMIQLSGLFSGGILMLEGIIFNFQNKVIVFISLLVILIVFGLGAWKMIKKYQKKEKR
jgi:hypothetical protein